MYCPVDGDEFVEGITRCPEHDVDLVEEPPDLDEDVVRLADYLTEHATLRLALIVLVAAAIIYALSGVVVGALYGLSEAVGWFAPLNVASAVQFAARPVALAALGIIVGAVLLRAYTTMRDGSGAGSPSEASSPADALSRLLYTLLIVFTILWAATGIATARQTAEVEGLRFLGPGFEEERPSDTIILLNAIHYAAYNGGAACLVIMGGRLIVRWHGRMRSDV